MLDAFIGATSYWAIGWGLAYGEGGNLFCGGSEYFNYAMDYEKYPKWFFQVKRMITLKSYFLLLSVCVCCNCCYHCLWLNCRALPVWSLFPLQVTIHLFSPPYSIVLLKPSAPYCLVQISPFSALSLPAGSTPLFLIGHGNTFIIIHLSEPGLSASITLEIVQTSF